MNVLFDFDGVLGDTLERMLEHARAASIEVGAPCVPAREHLNALEKMEFLELGRTMGIPAEKLELFEAEILSRFRGDTRPVPVFPGVAKAVLRISALARLGIVTGNSEKTVLDYLDSNGLAGRFEFVLGGDVRKTRSRKIREGARRFGGPVSEVVLVGDARSDIAAARETGATSVAVTWGHQSRERLSGAGPDYLVDSPEELLRLLERLYADRERTGTSGNVERTETKE